MVELHSVPESLVALVAGWRYQPFRYHRVAAREKLTRFSEAVLRDCSQANKDSTWVASSADRSGFIAVRLQPWDTEQLGLRTARIENFFVTGPDEGSREVRSALLSGALQYAQQQRIEYLTVRVDAADLPTLHVLGHAGFEMIDGIMTSAIALEASAKHLHHDGISVRLGRLADADAVAALAEKSYSVDRFHADRLVSKRANSVNATWARNAFHGGPDSCVVVAERDGDLAGFVTCRLHDRTKEFFGSPIGCIVLVATDQKHRGKGVGRAMTLFCLDWFLERGCSSVDVGTQLANVPAIRFYESCGFQSVGSSITLRKSNLGNV